MKNEARIIDIFAFELSNFFRCVGWGIGAVLGQPTGIFDPCDIVKISKIRCWWKARKERRKFFTVINH